MGDQAQLLQAIRGIFDEKVKPLVDGINERIVRNEARTEEAHSRLDDHAARLQRLEEGSTTSAFTPKSIEFKGFCEWKDRKSAG
eukprot:8113298-Pyramimonas_sp.AAC.1